MDVRTATPDDAQAIAAFDCFGGDRPGALKDGRCLVAEIDRQIAGYLAFKRQHLIGKDFVEFLVVHDDYRRRGIAVALLRAVEKEIGSGRLYISTGGDNTRMQALLAKDGWTAAGQIEGVNPGGDPELFFFRDLA